MLFQNWNSLLARLTLILVLLTELFSAVHAETVYAATLTVTNTNDSGAGSLRQRIIDAASGDIITFDPSLTGQTITLASALVINKNLMIDGSSLSSAVNISGNNVVTVIMVNSFVTVTIQKLIIRNGKASENGGGIYLNTGSTLTVVNSIFSANSAVVDPYAVGSGEGGAIYSLGTLNVANNSFSGNTAQRAGAISCNGNGATINISNSTFSSNTALSDTGGDGGAIYAACNATVLNSTFSMNIANHNGGAILADNDVNTVEVTNNTFYNNSASSGGGIANYGLLMIKNSTFSNNQSSSTGGAVRVGLGGSLSLQNSLLANSTGGVDCSKSDGAPVVENINNLIETTGADFESCGTSLLTSDPALGPLQDNGGPTQTMAVGPGSPAIDAGDNGTCWPADQRGVKRPQGLACDIGAYEYQTSIRYVKANANGANNGTSWTHAYTSLQSALAAAYSGDQIWVASGTYKPTTGTDRAISFALKNSVEIYGGFAGTETSLAQRNPTTNVTILSGDIGIQGSNSDNSYHVVVGSGTNNSALLDGFTITAGNANGDIYSAHQSYGGGMYNYLGSPTLINMIFSENSALLWGGGLYNLGDYIYLQNVGSNPILTNVVFIGNSAIEGGGMRNAEYSSPILNNVTFSNNVATRSGGGMENINYSNPILNNVTFDNNAIPASGGTSTFKAGGAIMNWGSSSPVLTNVTITANSAINEGGGIYNDYGSNPILKNVTLSNNSANQGGGLYNASGSNPVTVNSIFYGNSGGQIYDESGTKPVTNSIVQGGYAGIGNLDADPLLGSLADNGGFTETMALGVGSPAINAGTNEGCPEKDQRGVKRPQGGQCDIGAYEYRLDATFEDVPWDHWAWSYIEALYNAGVTAGCSASPLLYCPTTTVTRDQMAVFLLKAKYGSGHIPPTPTGVFQDVPTDYWAAPWIEELAAEGITSGCSISPKLYCPTTTVTRDQMAVFLLKAKYGSGHIPPTPTGVFQDVPTNYWAAAWIEELAAEGITSGCSVSPKLYCPATPVSRDQMAVFLDKAFGIPLLP